MRYTIIKTAVYLTLIPAVSHVQAGEVSQNSGNIELMLSPIETVSHYRTQSEINDIRSITRLEQADIANQQIERVEDLVEYSPGILGSSQTAGTETSLFVRGFRTDNGNVFVNRHQDNKRLFSRDLDTVEQVDIIKGHSSVLFGSGSPGGTIHYQTKRPKAQQSTTLTGTMGSFQKRRLALDATGSTGIEGLNYRLVAIGQDANSFMENVGNDKQVLFGALGWQYQDNSHVRVELEYDRLKNPYSFGIVRMNNTVLYDKSYVDPRTSSDRQYLRGSVYWQHAFNDQWKVNALVNYANLKRNDILMGFFFKLDESSLLGYWADSANQFWQMNGKIELTGEAELAAMTHDLTIGAEYNQSDNDLDRIRSANFTLDPINPSFDRAEPRDSAVDRGFHYRDRDKSLYVLDNIQLTKQLGLTAGLRYSQFHNVNRLTDTVSVDQNAVASTLGLSWALSQKATVYGSYAKSFEPNSGVSRTGEYFDPREAEQKEVGLRWQPNADVYLQGAIYSLTQKNLLTRDPEDRDYSISTGERRTQGVEIEAVLDLSSHLQLQAAYSHLKNEVTEDFFGLLGNSASGIPRNTASVRLNWQSLKLSGLHGNIGVIGVGERYGDAANSFALPGYGRVDAGLRYEAKKATYRLTIENLLNKRYVAAPFAEDDLYQGRRRNITASVAYQW